jgi:hypothetical protein
MRKLLVAAFLLVASFSAAHATCPSSLLLKDAAGVTAPGKYTDDGNGNCVPNVAPTLGIASGGWTPLTKTGLSTTVTAIKPSAGQLGFAQCDNPNTSITYVQIFNLAAGSVTLGTTAPVQLIPIPANLSNGFVTNIVGIQYSTAISAAATTTPTGSSAPVTAINCTFGVN